VFCLGRAWNIVSPLNRLNRGVAIAGATIHAPSVQKPFNDDGLQISCVATRAGRVASRSAARATESCQLSSRRLRVAVSTRRACLQRRSHLRSRFRFVGKRCERSALTGGPASIWRLRSRGIVMSSTE
jgi:hypothetical protein